jgi:hypothetical protein
MAGAQIQIQNAVTPPVDQPVLQASITSRFSQAWQRWFYAIQKKLNTINSNVVGISNISGSGVVVTDGNGNFTTESISSNGGIQGTYGTIGGSPITGTPTITGIATANYTLASWAIECYPSGSISIDVQQGALGSSTTSIVGSGNTPNISSAVSNSANISGWTSVAITKGNLVTFKVTSFSGSIEWFTISLQGTRS